jgi:dienelactone hydrolase
MEAKNLPLVVNPHGGPWARDNWGFNPYAQLLANRGYAVLQMNFRGSTGYGKQFINAGNKQWGKLMQDDITWGVKYLVDKGIADPKRVGIFGGSYGGYATLAGLTITPDVYACGVDLVGPSNLITLLKSIPPYWEAGRKEFTERMGDFSTPEGAAFLKSISPLFLVDNIKAPLMVVQGANDPRVKKAESDQIIVAMREKGLPVSYLLAMDEGHGFHDATNNMAFVAAMEAFLHQYLGGRYQQSMSTEVATRLKTLTQDIAAVKLPETSNMAAIMPLQTKGALTERTLVYDMKIEAGGQKMNFDYHVSVKKGDNSWNITEQATTPMGEMKIASAVSAADYTVLSKNIEQGPAKVSYAVANNKINGSIDAMGSKMPIDVTTEGKKLFAADEGVAQCIGLLPLDKGYSTTYAAFDFQTMQLKHYTIHVEGMEQITVPKGAYDCYKVKINETDGGEGSVVWVDKSTNTICKMTSKNPQATYSFELKK